MTRNVRGRHNRRSVRLRGYDYRQPGAYFVTVNVQGGHCLLGEVVDGDVRLTDLGRIADAFWEQVPVRFPSVSIDQRVVMPNHVHAIVVIHESVRDGRGGVLPPVRPPRTPNHLSVGHATSHPAGANTAPLRDNVSAGEGPSLGQIVAYYKHQTTVQINAHCGREAMRFWQRSYYDKVIRNRRALDAIRTYVADNPRNWALDPDHPNHGPGIDKGSAYVH